MEFGTGAPAFRILIRSDTPLTVPLSDYSLARAYVNRDIDVEGDLMALLSLRELLHFDIPLSQILRLGADLLLPPTLANAEAIDFHYSLGDDFYLAFLDRKYHFYSQCLFESDEETLEQAAEHKLERMWAALDVRPGMRLLDIGGGWGGLAAYASARGVHVTSLTLTRESAEYIRRRTSALEVPAEVRVEDILDHFPGKPYDHAVIFGVIEHVPNYRRFSERVWAALRPGGRLYVDASATREKYASSAFTREYTWHGPHSCLALQNLIEELLFHGFDVLGVRQESRDYELTMHHWATRLDAAPSASSIGGRRRSIALFACSCGAGRKVQDQPAAGLQPGRRTAPRPRAPAWRAPSSRAFPRLVGQPLRSESGMPPARAEPAASAVADALLRRGLLLSGKPATLPALLERPREREHHRALHGAREPRPERLLVPTGERRHRDDRREITADVTAFVDVEREHSHIPFGGVHERGLERMQESEVGRRSIAWVDVHVVPRMPGASCCSPRRMARCPTRASPTPTSTLNVSSRSR